MFFSRNKNISKEDFKQVAVFDFGSLSVKILLCNYHDDRVEVVSGRKVSYPPGTFTSDGEIRTEQLVPALDGVLAELSAGGISGRPKYAVIGVGGLGAEGYTSQINYRRAAKDKVIETAEFRSILSKVEERANQIMKDMIVWETGSDQEALINSEVLDLSLDGHAIASPVGSKGEKLSFVIYNGYTKKRILGGLISAVKRLDMELVSVGATAYAGLRTLLESNDSVDSFLYLDIGGRVTEVGVVSRGRIIAHGCFDIAGASFTSAIAEALGKTEEEAEIIKLGFADSKLDEEMMREVREVVSSDCKVFLSGVELVLKEFPGLQDIPSQIMVAGGGSLLPGIISCFQDDELVFCGMEAGQLKVNHLAPQELKGYADASGELNSPADVPTLSVALDAADLVRELGFDQTFWGNFLSRAK